MSKINIGSRYVNSRNGRVAVLAKQDSRTGNLTLMYEEVREDGKKGLDVTKPTFNRWWKLLEDEQVMEDETAIVMQQKKDLGIECPTIDSYEVVEQNEMAGDGTPYSEVMSEIIADEKTAQKKAQAAKTKKTGKKSPKQRKPQVEEEWVTESLTYIFALVLNKDDEIFTPAKEGMKMRTFKTGGHMYAKLNYSNKSITLAVQSAAVSDTNPSKQINHMFDNGYVFTGKLSAADKSLITRLLKEARNYRINKNLHKTKKEEK